MKRLQPFHAKVRLSTNVLYATTEGPITACMFEMMRHIGSADIREVALAKLNEIHAQMTAAEAAKAIK